jgi:Flp pilus assembly protein TadD
MTVLKQAETMTRSAIGACAALMLVASAGCGGGAPRVAELEADPPVDPSGGVAIATANLGVKRAAEFIKNKHFDEAAEQLDFALSRQPSNAMAHYYLGVVLEERHDLANAEVRYKRAIEYDASLVEPRINLAAIYLEAEVPRSGEAIGLLRAALAIDPTDERVHQNLALAYSLGQDLDRAGKEYEWLLSKKDDPSNRYEYAMILHQTKRDDEAARLLTGHVDQAADDPTVLSRMGFILSTGKVYADCVRAFDRALKLKPGVIEWSMRRGGCRHHIGDEEGARADFATVVQAEPKNAFAHFYLGASLDAVGRQFEAFDEFVKVAELVEDDELGRAARQQLDKMWKIRRAKGTPKIIHKKY